jgi:hypothetical protein
MIAVAGSVRQSTTNLNSEPISPAQCVPNEVSAIEATPH